MTDNIKVLKLNAILKKVFFHVKQTFEKKFILQNADHFQYN